MPLSLFDTYFRNQANNILNTGIKHRDTYAHFDSQVTFPGDALPLLSLRKMHLDGIFREIQWTLDGHYNIQPLGPTQAIWKPWANQNLDLESSYGRFLRSFPTISYPHDNEAVAPDSRVTSSPAGIDGIDQLRQLLDGLLQPKPSRRLHISLWHPDNSFYANQPPCMTGMTLNWYPSSDNPFDNGYTTKLGGRKLISSVHFRSSDFALGFCFDVFQWYIVTLFLATLANKHLPRDQHYTLEYYTFKADNQHIYFNHISPLGRFLDYEPVSLPSLQVYTQYPEQSKGHVYSLSALGHTVWFEITNYNPGPHIKLEMAINTLEF